MFDKVSGVSTLQHQFMLALRDNLRSIEDDKVRGLLLPSTNCDDQAYRLTIIH